MTYEEFKKELYHNIIISGALRCKKVLLFEKRRTVTDKEYIKLIRKINYCRYGCKSILVNEDLLCVFWYDKEIMKYRYWPVEMLYDGYQKTKWNDLLPEIIFKIWNDSYEQYKDRLIVKPVNYEQNSQELQECVFWSIGEHFALVLYDVLCVAEGEPYMVKVSRETVRQWGISDDNVFWDALLNTKRKMPPRLFHANDPDYRKKSNGGIFMPGDGKRNISIDMNSREERAAGYRLTTPSRMGGAVALFYPGVKEQIGNLLGSDYYVGFICADEVMIYPVKNHITESLRRKVQSVNVRMDTRNVLSSSIFRYSVARRDLIEV